MGTHFHGESSVVPDVSIPLLAVNLRAKLDWDESFKSLKLQGCETHQLPASSDLCIFDLMLSLASDNDETVSTDKDCSF